MATRPSEANDRTLARSTPRGAILARVMQSEALWLGLLLIATIFLAGYGLDRYPRLGFDEGYYLQLSKNLALHGEYALTSPAQPADRFGLGNSSPTLILPIATIFKLTGVGVAPTRWVPGLYFAGAVVAIYLVMRRLYDWPTAVLAGALFLVAGPRDEFNTVWMGRKVLGEVPALFFVMMGAWFWSQSWRDMRWRWLLAAGAAFGLAFITKEQFIPFVTLALVLAWLFDRIVHRQLSARHLLVPLLLSGVPVASWYAYKLAVLGPEMFVAHLNTLSAVSSASTWLFEPDRWAGHLAFLYNNAFVFIGLPGILYAIVGAFRRDVRSLGSLFLAVLASLFLAWFVFLSIGWTRYAYIGLAISAILAARPLRDLTSGLTFSFRQVKEDLHQERLARPVVAAIVGAVIIGYPLQDLGRAVLVGEDRSPQDFANFVEAHTESDALIETFAWEIDYLSSRQFHHPPPSVFVQILQRDRDRRSDPIDYDPLAYEPDYLIDGPYSKGSHLYPLPWLRLHWRLVGTVGGYDLYAIRKAE